MGIYYKMVAIDAVNDEVWIRAADVQELNHIFVEIQEFAGLKWAGSTPRHLSV